MKEVFGSYFAEHAGGFWSYDPVTKVWEQHHEQDPGELPAPSNLAAEDCKGFNDAAKWVCTLARPATPSDASKLHRQEPFIYSGFLFQWLFVPELCRWELLPLGKHQGEVVKQ